MKVIRPLSLVIIGICVYAVSNGQAASATVPVKPVANVVANPSSVANNKSSSSSLNINRIKTIDKKKRKPSHVTTVKKSTDTLPTSKK